MRSADVPPLTVVGPATLSDAVAAPGLRFNSKVRLDTQASLVDDEKSPGVISFEFPGSGSAVCSPRGSIESPGYSRRRKSRLRRNTLRISVNEGRSPSMTLDGSPLSPASSRLPWSAHSPKGSPRASPRSSLRKSRTSFEASGLFVGSEKMSAFRGARWNNSGAGETH